MLRAQSWQPTTVRRRPVPVRVGAEQRLHTSSLLHIAQNVLTAVALDEQLFDELEHILPRVTSYRPHLLSDGDGALGEG
jgi:hypothetical protein